MTKMILVTGQHYQRLCALKSILDQIPNDQIFLHNWESDIYGIVWNRKKSIFSDFLDLEEIRDELEDDQISIDTDLVKVRQFADYFGLGWEDAEVLTATNLHSVSRQERVNAIRDRLAQIIEQYRQGLQDEESFTVK